MTDMEKLNPQPSIGRIIHYVSYGTPGGEFSSACRAAIITALSNDDQYHIQDHDNIRYVDLCVLNPSGLFFNEMVEYSEMHNGGTWHWPERT